jgi:phosphatidate phosphatase APP1
LLPKLRYTEASVRERGFDSAVKWRSEIRQLAKAILLKVEAFADATWRRSAHRTQFAQPRQIMAYIGHGNDSHVWVRGRVLANKPIRGPEEDDNWWDNLRATYQRWETDEVAGASVELLYGSQRRVVVTDEEGYYQALFKRDGESAHTEIVIARSQREGAAIVAQHKIMLPDPSAKYMVISDMDDTVIHTGITNVLLAARLTFLNNAKTRKPLAGVASLYRELARGTNGRAQNPIYYVSNSGWNMYDLLRDFIELNDIPRGPIFLRDLGLNPVERDSTDHKANTIRDLLAHYPKLPAVLIGDSGQHDAELYASVAKEFPDRIIAIYIRDVDPHHDSAHDAKVDAIIKDRSGGGIPMLRGRDSQAFAAHMQSVGLLPKSSQSKTAANAERD